MLLGFVTQAATAGWDATFHLSQPNFEVPVSVDKLAVPSGASGFNLGTLYRLGSGKWYAAASYASLSGAEVAADGVDNLTLAYTQTSLSAEFGRAFEFGKTSLLVGAGMSSVSSEPDGGSNAVLAAAFSSSYSTQHFFVNLRGQYAVTSKIYADLAYALYAGGMSRLMFGAGYRISSQPAAATKTAKTANTSGDQVTNPDAMAEPTQAIQATQFVQGVQEPTEEGFQEMRIDDMKINQAWDYLPTLREGKQNHQLNPDQEIDDYTGKWTITLAEYRIYEQALSAVIRIRSLGIQSYLKQRVDNGRYVVFAKNGSSYEEAVETYKSLREQFAP